LFYDEYSTFVTYKNELYSFGSISNLIENHTDLIKYNPITNTWSNLPDSYILDYFPPTNTFTDGRIHHAIEFQNELYIAGSFVRIGDKDLKLQRYYRFRSFQ